jgi:hypothetical protein
VKEEGYKLEGIIRDNANEAVKVTTKFRTLNERFV